MKNLLSYIHWNSLTKVKAYSGSKLDQYFDTRFIVWSQLFQGQNNFLYSHIAVPVPEGMLKWTVAEKCDLFIYQYSSWSCTLLMNISIFASMAIVVWYGLQGVFVLLMVINHDTFLCVIWPNFLKCRLWIVFTSLLWPPCDVYIRCITSS